MGWKSNYEVAQGVIEAFSFSGCIIVLPLFFNGITALVSATFRALLSLTLVAAERGPHYHEV